MRQPIALSLLLLAGCGSARAATHSWQATDFSTIRVEGPFDVRVHAGQPAGVRATGPQAAIDRVVVEQNGDTLVIHPARALGTSNWSWTKGDALVIDVGVRALTAATLAGSGDLHVDRMHGEAVALALAGSGDLSVDAIDAGTAKLTATGSGDLSAAGRARTVAVTLTGSGDIHGSKLVAGDTTVSLVGSGDLTLGATGNATGSLAGSGDITITGPARCTIAKGGSGDVSCGAGG